MKAKRTISEIIESRISHSMRGIGRVVAGFSGGADSTALLLGLRSAEVETVAVHCNFHLRGEESMRDEKAAREFCDRFGIEFIKIDFDASAEAERTGTSLEMACRDLRYAEFRRLMKEFGADRIAVAHNSDDNVETLLLNLFRGGGVAGLRGMLPDSGEIVRPLLGTSREEIENYLTERGVEFVVDSTNLESDYRRNFIRNELLPMIESRWPGVKKAMGKTLENLRMDEIVLQWAEGELCGEDGGEFLSFSRIAASPSPEWIIRRFAVRFGASRDIIMEMGDVFRKRYGTQHIIGKEWKTARGRFKYSKNGLHFFAG